LLGASVAARSIRAGELNATDLIRACLDRIDRFDALVRAWVLVDRHAALLQADRVATAVVAGRSIGALAGVPVGVKDIFNTRDMPTQMGSPIWADFHPGNDARVVHYLRMADAVIPGKTVTAEFAVHAPGPTRNPHNIEYMPGTSSSGSAVAVATGMVPISIGTQTAGSIIRPASYCGVFGFKPSFGLLPRTGSLKTTDSLDTVGMFARDLDDLKLLFEIMRVHGRDYPLAEVALNDPARQSKPEARPWRIALVRGPKWDEAEPYARDALMQAGRRIANAPDVVVEDVEIQELADAHEIHSRIYDRALAYYFKEEFKKHTLVSAVMYEIIERGNRLSLEDYTAALDQQHRIAQRLDDILARDYDVIVTLSTGGEAQRGLDRVDRPDTCLIWTLAHLPAISLPAFRGPLGLPMGLQVVARRYSDHLLLQCARLLCEVLLVPQGRELVVDPSAQPVTRSDGVTQRSAPPDLATRS
jgi:Asp-tRNA(Asn)/Glu-tRNA(Gln) amidotransferase A subunit family amidase